MSESRTTSTDKRRHLMKSMIGGKPGLIMGYRAQHWEDSVSYKPINGSAENDLGGYILLLGSLLQLHVYLQPLAIDIYYVKKNFPVYKTMQGQYESPTENRPTKNYSIIITRWAIPNNL